MGEFRGGFFERGLFEFVNQRGAAPSHIFFLFSFLRQPNKCECKQNRSNNTFSLSFSLPVSFFTLFLSLSNACILAINRICWQAKKSLNFGRKFNMRNAQEFCIHCSWLKIYETSWRINHIGMPYDQEYITIYSMWK